MDKLEKNGNINRAHLFLTVNRFPEELVLGFRKSAALGTEW